ncbi:MAG: TonB-dependent receptor plug domain-containing protein [Saprospiraceae bacterium]|nr:TonB-dependent receptor plug domain-containing protein [Saprospiraceae bacterium]
MYQWFYKKVQVFKYNKTSPTSGNASIRVQGLDGRYTQLLKDGYPNFGNFASGLSILEIPPLDLKQVEVIKGPASTLYGGGAIAGVINFVSENTKRKSRKQFYLKPISYRTKQYWCLFFAMKRQIWIYNFGFSEPSTCL